MPPVPHNPFAVYLRPGLRVPAPRRFVADDGAQIAERERPRVGRALETRRLVGALAGVGVGLLVLVGQLVWLQGYRGATFRQMAEGNRIRLVSIPAPRGKIYDRRGVLLADNQPEYRLVVVPADLPRDAGALAAVTTALGDLVGQPPEAVASELAAYDLRSYQPQVLQDALTEEQAVRVRVAEGDLPGVSLQIGARRQYVYADVTSLGHLLGYVSRVSPRDLEQSDTYDPTDRVGRTGFEQQYEGSLRGVKGRQQVEVTAQGAQREIIAHRDPMPGQDLAMSLDVVLQREVELRLTRTLRSLGLRRGAAVALDPRTGEVLALVSLPAFDANRFTTGLPAAEFDALLQDPDRPLFPRATSGTYPSGSTVKPIIAAAALEAGVVGPSTVITSTGGITVGAWFFPDWKTGGHGPTTLTKAIAESVNTYFYTIGGGYQQFTGLGLDRLTRALRAAGLGQPTGVDLPGEASGLVPSEAWKEATRGEPWYIGDTYHLSIGQGDLLVTPLQVANWTALVANGGTLFRPRLALGSVGLGGLAAKGAPVVVRRVFAGGDHLALVRSAMRATVTVGSARALADALVPIAGKTGTAEWSDRRRPHGWFTGFAPAGEPELVVTVLIEEGGEGSRGATTVAKDIINWWAVNRMGVALPRVRTQTATSTPTGTNTVSE